jgi:ribonuclease HI
VTLSADLARAVSRAAARAGISPQAYLEDAVRLALELKPPGVARVRAELQKAS